MHDTGFPGGPVVKNPLFNGGDAGLIPGPGRYHKLQGQLSSLAITPEPVCPEPLLLNKRSRCNEERVHHS